MKVDISYHNISKKISYDCHYLKSKNCFDNGFICIHIWDWTDINEIINNILNNKYNNIIIVRREIKEFLFNIKTKELLEKKLNSKEKTLKDFHKIYDDGYDIIFK